jgi:hypothetical protein
MENKLRTNVSHVYFDCDGVLTDLDRYVKSQLLEQLSEHDFKMWLRERIDKDKIFENLPSNPFLCHFKNLIEYLQSNDVICSTLTSLGGNAHHTNIYSQKKKWLENHYLDHLNFLVVEECHQKALLSHKGAFLIDDKHSNVNEFNAGLGTAIIYDNQDHHKAFTKILDALRIKESML